MEFSKLPPEGKLNRLLRPRHIAVMGGSWAHNVVTQCQAMGFIGEIWPVHPKLETVAGLRCFASLDELPGAPDATFIGINRFLTINAVKQLAAMGAGGAVCFASGFAEAAREDDQATRLQQELLLAAGPMPIIGPNCYGLINYLDGALLWPDQHGGERVDSGVAIITQSSNIAINLTMQSRAVPIAYILTAGNQAQISLGQLASAVIADERVTALALHIETYGDIEAFEQMAVQAKQVGKPVIALKMGRSTQSQQAMVSHTNSISGDDSAASAFLERVGIARVYSLSVLLETLKLVHLFGTLPNNKVQSMSCSGGEAGLVSDAAVNLNVEFPALCERQCQQLRAALGDMVALANPLDYHTFIWDDLPAMTETFAAMLRSTAAINLLILDFPRADRCQYDSWHTAIQALCTARDITQTRVAVVATLPENLPEFMARELLAKNVLPLCGVDDALCAIEAAAFLGRAVTDDDYMPVLKSLAANTAEPRLLDEATAKGLLAEMGVRVPVSSIVSKEDDLVECAEKIGYPVVLKRIGIAHKTEANAITLGIENQTQLLSAVQSMPTSGAGYLLEEQIEKVIAELLVSIVRDPTHGFQLTLAAGGIMAELFSDAQQLLLPVNESQIRQALSRLKVSALLNGYRGRQGANLEAVVSIIVLLQHFAITRHLELHELEINPLLCTAQDAVVADALISITGVNHEW